MRNDQAVTSIPKGFTQAQKICFPDLNSRDDIIELRHGGHDGVSISVNLIEAGNTTPLKFGKNQDLDVLRIDSAATSSMGWICKETVESTGILKIQNGKIIESECVKHCIEIIPKEGNTGNPILLLRNDETIFTIPSGFTQTQKICFADLANDIIELRQTGNNGVSISVNLIEAGNTMSLKFGKNQDLDVLRIDS